MPEEDKINEFDEIVLNDLAVAAGLPRSYNDCKCPCHYTPGMVHMSACCHPPIEITEKSMVEKIQYDGYDYYAIKTKSSIYLQRCGLRSGSDTVFSTEEEVILSLCEFIINQQGK